jgi:hypothetical protein
VAGVSHESHERHASSEHASPSRGCFAPRQRDRMGILRMRRARAM